MPNVFILNKGSYDYSAAKRYGSLVYCSDGPLKKNDINQMARLMEKALDASEPEDYIVLTSLSSLCSIACAIFAAKHNRLNLLLYRAGQYYEYTILIHTKEETGS